MAASPGMSVGVVPDALRLFSQSHPSVHVTVQINDTSTITKWTAAGYCDFALSSFVPDPHPVERLLLHRGRAVCLLPEGHRLAGKRMIRSSDLAGKSFISLTPKRPGYAVDRRVQARLAQRRHRNHPRSDCVNDGLTRSGGQCDGSASISRTWAAGRGGAPVRSAVVL
ncbi:LysR substrate-binding domain-containing protein [Variovorax fucosicus]|uniref:LysR substrate-binding domain-containing protein n=1 Tax=Variovorax fucosicus TaxID=3053517 RepID=UPI0033655FF9